MTGTQAADRQLNDHDDHGDLDRHHEGALPVAGVGPDRSVGQRAALHALHAYQSARACQLSPCRFYPSCSAYAVEAVERHGAARGMWLAVKRLARCHPLGGRGVDLVPLDVGRRHRRGKG